MFFPKKEEKVFIVEVSFELGYKIWLDSTKRTLHMLEWYSLNIAFSTIWENLPGIIKIFFFYCCIKLPRDREINKKGDL